jgi:4-hydroxybenzoyl-CoA thioesterase
MRDASSLPIDATFEPTSMCAYHALVLVRFAHCDPAGMVFFPRYMEMFNDLVEDWCREKLQISFAEMHFERGWGLATAHLDVDFVAPSYLGEELSASLEVRKIGTSSVQLDIALRGVEGGLRVRGQMVLVMIDMKSKRARALPNDVRSRIAAFQAESC